MGTVGSSIGTMADSLSPAAGSQTLNSFDVAIFDMDGLLLESESLWRIAEREATEQLGIPLTDIDFNSTMGVRMRDVAHIWFNRFPWEGPSPDEVADRVISRLMELLADPEELPGVTAALQTCADHGLRIALCSSSDERVIEAAVRSLGLGSWFEVSHSAEHDEFGKPHPQPFLSTATKLGVEPDRCLVFEDSVAGCVSAKSAGMTVVAVPDPSNVASPKFGIADLVLTSLRHFDAEVLTLLDDKTPVPTLSRPRFHLAFPVSDLGAARDFYGGLLGCVEGRSADTWVDFDLWGHQIVAHVSDNHEPPSTNEVDGHDVPASHFGLLLHTSAWNELVERLEAGNVPFVMKPTVRFAGLAGEQRTCFVLDPAGNALEFKAFTDDRQVFAQ